MCNYIPSVLTLYTPSPAGPVETGAVRQRRRGQRVPEPGALDQGHLRRHLRPAAHPPAVREEAGGDGRAGGYGARRARRGAADLRGDHTHLRREGVVSVCLSG